MSSPYDGAGWPRVHFDELVASFSESERPDGTGLIGAESEKIGVHRLHGTPLGYGQAFGVCKVLADLAEVHGWTPVRETEDGPTLGLVRGRANVTLEPGAQLELSGAPLADVHAVAREARAHLDEIAAVSERLGIAWLGVGFHPLARLDELPWVPKQRYPIMRSYLPTRGSGAHDMMQRTATVQVNFDRRSEADAFRKIAVALRFSPLVHALAVNAPFKEGKLSGRLSERGDVWLRMDPSRSGLLEPLWRRPVGELSYRDYTEWALDAGMFLIWRDGKVLENTGQTFRDFLEKGFQGHHATLVDWKLHLTTLFPEVRLKNTIEVRSADAQQLPLQLALVALWTGLLYDEQSLSTALDWAESLRFEQVEGARPELVAAGLRASVAPFGARTNFQAAERLLELARSGLGRRARKDGSGADESVYLEPLVELLSRGLHPADRAIERFHATSGSSIERIVQALPLEAALPNS